MKTALITGSTGLVGSECVLFFAARGFAVHGIDNNLRADFFGPDGDTSWNLAHVQRAAPGYVHHALDVRDRGAMETVVRDVAPELIVHCAAQPSHDLAAARPFDDFEVNAVGTLNVLEAARRCSPEASFCMMSTNKVYGDAPNELPLVELPTRWDYADPAHRDGVDESMRIDATLHSLFGVSKTAADLLVQEYGRYFQMKTVCFRAGCLTGAAHSAAELHGFLAYVVRCVREGRAYRVYGYKGKQVRDNLHAYDVCRAVEEFHAAPRVGAVYNLGGGRENSISVLEAIDAVEQRMNKKIAVEYVDQARKGDHICYISNTAELRSDYPNWHVARSLDGILDEMCAASRSASRGGAEA